MIPTLNGHKKIRTAKKRQGSFIPDPANQKTWLPWLMVGCTSIALFNSCQNFGLKQEVRKTQALNRIRLVERPDGTVKTAVALAKGNTGPSDEMIRGKVNRVMFSLHNWRGVLPPEDDTEVGKTRPDEGVEIGKKGKIPYLAWKNTFALKEGFREEYQKKLSTLVPQGVFSSPPTAFGVPELRKVGIPQKVGKDEWIVTWHGILSIFDRANTAKTIGLKYEVHVQRIDAYQPCPGLSVEDCEAELSDTQKAIYQQQRDGLLITKFKELD